MPVTLLRDGGSFGVYFLTYAVLKDALEPQLSSVLAQFIAGGIAGAISWATCYPTDVIKSRIQLAPDNATGAPIRMWEVAKSICRNEGYAGLTRGMGVCCFRAIPNNGVIFVVYEYSMSLLNQY